MIALAKGLGVTSDLPPHPSLALGSAEAHLLELTAAYAAVLADVRRVEPYVVAPRGRRRRHLPATPDGRRAGLSPTVRAMMGDVRDAVRTGTGSAAGLRRCVGKTGTTPDHRDAWFVGFTEDLVVGVWVGNDDYRRCPA